MTRDRFSRGTSQIESDIGCQVRIRVAANTIGSEELLLVISHAV
jgi:hypothetical protein